MNNSTREAGADVSRISGRNGSELPFLGLLALAMAGFIAIMTETMPAGLLPQISAGLGVSEGLAGQLLTTYAIGSVAAGIPVIAATRGWRRRRLLLSALGVLCTFNALTAVSDSYGLTLAARFVAGMAAGVLWGLVAGYARRMVPEALQGRALAVVGVGQPLALSFGVPLGAFLGSAFDWRSVFWIMTGLCLFLMAWVRVVVPDFPGQAAHERIPIGQVFRTPGVQAVLWVVMLWILAHNVLYTYIAPFAVQAGLAQRLDLVLLAFGLAALVGIWGTGVMVDRNLRAVALVSLAGFSAAGLLLSLFHDIPALVIIGVIVWGAAFGGAPTILQTAIAHAAGKGADLAQSMLVTVFNLAVAGGGIAGGLLLEGFGPRWLSWAMLAFTGMALAITWAAKMHGFAPPRQHLANI